MTAGPDPTHDEASTPGAPGARLALVTGASRGIGRAVALALGGAGHRLALTSRSPDALAETARLVEEATGSRPAVVPCDLSDRASSLRLVERVEDEAGAGIDVLAHVAGVAPSSKSTDVTDDQWDLAMELNATAAFVLCRAVLPRLIEQQWGRIVVVASTAGRVGYPYTAAYTASKHALVGLVRALAVEHARHGVTVNAACPGFTETQLLDEAIANIVERAQVPAAEAKRRLAGYSPQQRLIEPAEVAALVAYLASHEARGINGQAIALDGGSVTT